MPSRASQLVATLVLLICFACPLVELFDYWDDTVLTGNDTEYGLVVLALCVGVAYTFARFVSKSWMIHDFVSRSFVAPGVDNPSWSKARYCELLLFEDRSPPGLPLRI
jgi:hypothetical protein